MVQADSLSGYDTICHELKIVRVACWAHARRYFVDPRDADPARAAEALLFSLTSSCRRNGFEPFAYLCDIFARLADLRIRSADPAAIAALLPHRWTPPPPADCRSHCPATQLCLTRRTKTGRLRLNCPQLRVRQVTCRSDDEEVKHDEQPEHDQEGRFAALVTESALSVEGAGPASRERQEMECAFRDSATAKDGTPFIPPIRADAKNAHHGQEADVNESQNCKLLSNCRRVQFHRDCHS